MTEQEPLEARHRRDGLRIDLLATSTDDPEILARWESGLAQWGYAFVAFSRLGPPSFHTAAVLTSFENLFVATLPSMDALFQDHLEGMGWRQPVIDLRERFGILDEYLVWNQAAVMSAFREFMDVVEEGDEVHVFLK